MVVDLSCGGLAIDLGRTIPLRAQVESMGRGRAHELKPSYFLDGVAYCKAMAQEMSMPSLFDFEEAEQGIAA